MAQIVQALRRAEALQVGRGGTGHLFQLAQAARHHVAVPQFADAHHAVDALP